MRRRLPLLQANNSGISSWSSPFARIALEQPAWLQVVRSTGIVLVGSAFVAVCAHVAIPLFFTPVPLSLVTFAVVLLGLLLRPGLAVATLGAYLLEGALGLPVFGPTASAPAGLAHLFGPTGGYLLSYPLAAALIAFLMRRSPRSGDAAQRFAGAAFSAASGHLLILVSGAIWLMLLSHGSLVSTLDMAILPFLPGDALKVVVAAAIAAGWMRSRRAA